MSLPLSLAHQRYIQQARWTQQLRRHIFSRAGLPNARRVLEIGCGTGAVMRTINLGAKTQIFGLDIDRPALQIAAQEASSASFANGDAYCLPFRDSAFDISFFHFVLLWLTDPVAALVQARRVTRQGGAVIAFAEPDYSQRTSSNPQLSRLGSLQNASLQTQGADPHVGARLGELFKSAEMEPIEFGQLDLDSTNMTNGDQTMEFDVLRSDLADTRSHEELEGLISSVSPTDLNDFNLPTFYCWGRVA